MFCKPTEQDQQSTVNSSCSETSQLEKFPSARHFKWIVTSLLVYFGLRLLCFATTIAPFIPPDEVTHFGMSQIYSKVLLIPENSPETYQYGLVTNIPWLYYWLMGKVYLLNVTGISDLRFLRIFNIPIAFGTVFFAWRTLRLLTNDRLVQLLLIVAMTNTIMFSFLSAAVSYDNLTNLLAAMAVYFLLAFFKERSGSLLAASFVCQLAGGLTKSAFLPLILILNLLLLIHEFKKLYKLPSALKDWFRTSWKSCLGLSLAIILGFALNIQLYGGNYLRYGTLAPELANVFPPEIVLQNRTQARNMIFTMYKDGNVSKEKALQLTGNITNSGDRDNAVDLIMNYEHLLKTGTPAIGPVEYIPIWVRGMMRGIFGIYAHLGMPCGLPKMYLFLSLLLLAGFAFMLRWRPRESGWMPAHLAFISFCYGLFLMYAVNYTTYIEYRLTWLALQGRYIFPVIGPIYVLLCYYLMQLARGRIARLGIFSLVTMIFIFSDFPYFLFYANSAWNTWSPI